LHDGVPRRVERIDLWLSDFTAIGNLGGGSGSESGPETTLETVSVDKSAMVSPPKVIQIPLGVAQEVFIHGQRCLLLDRAEPQYDS
jgi:hypothetical protein